MYLPSYCCLLFPVPVWRTRQVLLVYYCGGDCVLVANMSVLLPPSLYVFLSVGSFAVLDRFYASFVYRALDF